MSTDPINKGARECAEDVQRHVGFVLDYRTEGVASIIAAAMREVVSDLEDERDRYRDALDRIKRNGVWNEQHQRRDFEMIEIARAALAGRKTEGKKDGE